MSAQQTGVQNLGAGRGRVGVRRLARGAIFERNGTLRRGARYGAVAVRRGDWGARARGGRRRRREIQLCELSLDRVAPRLRGRRAV